MHLVGIAKKNSKDRFLNFFCEPVMKIQKTCMCIEVSCRVNQPVIIDRILVNDH